MEKTQYLRRFLESGANGEGADILQDGAHEIGKELNALCNRHINDMPLFIACIKSAMPHWERHLGKSGMKVCDDLCRSMLTVDGSALK